MTSGYACPVCDTPQRDAEHLANHLAFTAMLRAEEHEAWLDEHAPDWSTAGPDELAERVVGFADAAEYEEVFEDTVARSATGSRGDPGDTVHDRGDRGRPSVDAGDAAGRGYDGGGSRAGRPAGGGASDETAAVLEEARELTRRMYEDEGGDGSEDGDEDGAGAGADGGAGGSQPDSDSDSDSKPGRTGGDEGAEEGQES